MNAQQVIQRLARKAGIEVSRARAGQYAGYDIRSFAARTPRPLVLDVGANAGQSVSFFRELLPTSVIHCFEPGRSAFEQLQKNTAGLRGVCLNHVAVGGRAGVQRFLENEASDMSSFLPLGSEGWGSITHQFDVSVVTLDDYCSKAGIDRVDVLKSDTQGFDLEVLKGAEALLRDRRVGLVYTEVTFSDLYEDLPGFDVLYRFLVDRNMRLVALYNYEMRDGAAAWCDALFVAAQS